MTGTVASAVAASPFVAAPSIAGIHSDAALLRLGARFDAALAAWKGAYSDWKRRQAQFDAWMSALAPKTLRFDPRAPFAMRARWQDGDLFSDAEIAHMRARDWGDFQRRADRIVAAFDRWRPRRDAKAAALRLGDFDEGGPGLALENRVRDLQDEIAAMSRPTTLEGFAVKSRAILAQQNCFGLDQEDAMMELAEQIVRVTGVELPQFA